MIRDNFSFRSSSNTHARVFRSGSIVEAGQGQVLLQEEAEGVSDTLE